MIDPIIHTIVSLWMAIGSPVKEQIADTLVAFVCNAATEDVMLMRLSFQSHPSDGYRV